MKTIVSIVACILAISTVACVPVHQNVSGRPYAPNPRGFEQGLQQSQRRLESVTINKIQTGHCEARIIAGPANTPGNVQRVADYASQVRMKTGRVPSETELTQKFGFRAQARWIDTPDRTVKSIRVRPDEVPANIRARF